MSSYKNFGLIFSLIRAVFLIFFCFSTYRKADSENSTENYKSSKISIGVVMRNPEMLKFNPGHLKTKAMCDDVVKNYLL